MQEYILDLFLLICQVVAELRKAGKDVTSTLWEQIHFFLIILKVLFGNYFFCLFENESKLKSPVDLQIFLYLKNFIVSLV